MKFHNIKTVIDGITFASKKEAKRYGELKLMVKAGAFQELVLQPEFPIIINGIKICKYVGDFSYYENGKYILEDVKGFKTSVYRLKKKLMLAVHNIKITEI